ncbi:MAG: Cys-Gln thioester bond-forming surface protein [Bacilli bacterium]|nr:Cys-Gln thioester bond-forming surface protein [Bacilli bacterium]
MNISKKNKKRIKSNKLIILLLILFTGITSVYAKENDSVLVRNKQDGIFAIAPLSDRTHLYNLEIFTINNIPSYCIEIGKSITTTTYNSTDNIEEQQRITNLTKEQLEYINLVAYFGYQYEENEEKIHSEKEYYMATQEIIWEYLNKNLDITWTNEEDINGNRINIDSYINEIKSKINSYTEKLNVPSNVNLKIGDTITFFSSNLFLYKINNIQNIIGDKTNNNLKLSTVDNYFGTAKVVLSINNYTNIPKKVYSNNNSQLLISKGYIPSNTKEVTINIEGYKLETNLVDKDTKTTIPKGQATLEGAEYELYDKNNNLVTSFKFDSSLKYTIDNLYKEKYYIKQIKASEGYKKNEELIEVDLSKTGNITLEEEVIKRQFEINKFYEVNNKLEREENIEFTFKFYDKTTNYFGSIITTKQGSSIITLPYGKYKVIQENTTYGYEKAPILYFIVDREINNPYNYTLINKQIKTKLQITTKDKETLNEINDNQIKYKIKDEKGNYLSHNNIEAFSTDESGKLLLPFEIPYGTYYIEQVNSPKNYQNNKEILTIIINDKTNYINTEKELLVNIDYFNTKIKGSIKIITNKEENIDNKKIISKRENVEIEVYKDNVLINNYKTNKNGVLELNNLELATYCIKEKNTKECLVLTEDDNNKKVVLTEKINNNTIEIEEDNNTQITIPNTLSNRINILNYIKIILVLIGVIIYKKANNYINSSITITNSKRKQNKKQNSL